MSLKTSENKLGGALDHGQRSGESEKTPTIDEKKLMRKVDWHVIPWLGVLYLLSFLDRGAIGNAKLYHLAESIHITDKQYLLALTSFFFPYALLEPLSNIFLRRLRPSIYLSSLTLIWSIVMTLTGLVKDYGDLVAVRVLLGVFEAGLYPGIVFYISCWYKRSELGTRVAIFFSSASIAGAFRILRGLLSAAISNMDGIGGIRGWSWVFIIFGLATFVCSIGSFWIVQDFPEDAKFLNEAERAFIVQRLQADMQFSAGGEKLKLSNILKSVKDWKTWVAMAIYAGFDGPLFAFSLFTPSIINQLGYTATVANLLSVPIYVWACIMTVVIGVLGDRLGQRGYINLALFGTGLVGYIILICSKNPGLSYFAVYLAACSIYPTIPNSVAWLSSNMEGSYKRGVSLAMAIGFGNLNGAVTSNVYRGEDKPWYRLGHGIFFVWYHDKALKVLGIVLAYIIIGWLSSLLFFILLKRENARRDRGERDEVIQGVENKHADERNGVFESVDAARAEKGDEWSGFRYTL